MADASFKDVPEIFEVRVQRGLTLQSSLHCTEGRLRRVAHREDRKLVSVSIVLLKSLSRRTDFRCCAATFRELGPPDLCHVVKSTGRTGHRDVRAILAVQLEAADILNSKARIITCLGSTRLPLLRSPLISTLSHTQSRTMLGGFPKVRGGRSGTGATGVLS